MGNTSVIELLKRLTSGLADAPHLIAAALSRKEEYKDIYNPESFNSPDAHIIAQTACNTACGWGGIAGQAFTDFYAVALEYPHLEVAIICIGRPAYICKIDEAYRKHIATSALPLWDEVSASALNILWKAQK